MAEKRRKRKELKRLTLEEIEKQSGRAVRLAVERARRGIPRRPRPKPPKKEPFRPIFIGVQPKKPPKFEILPKKPQPTKKKKRSKR